MRIPCIYKPYTHLQLILLYFLLPTYFLSLPVNMIQLGDVFSLIEAAHNAVQRHVLDKGESYKTTHSNKKRYIIICKDNECGFRIQVSNI